MFTRSLAAILLFACPLLAGPPVTFEDVLARVQAGEQPGVLLEKCDTVFTLTATQKQQLNQAGAPAALVAALAKPRTNLSDVRNYALVVDCSGSMADEIEAGVTKMDAAKAALRKLVTRLPDRVAVSLTVYGHDAELKCKAVEVLRPLGAADAAGKKDLDGMIAGLKPAGHTPIALALTVAGKTLAGAEGLSQVVLVTDGLETCHGDPGKAAEALALTANVRDVSVIGFGLKPEEKSGVAEIARRGRGKFLDAQSAQGLAAAVKEVVAAEPKADADDLPAVVKALVEQLKDAEGPVREAAAVALGKMGAKAKGAVPALARRVADDVFAEHFSEGVYDKNAALAALKALAPKDVEAALLAAMKSKTPRVKTWAADALAQLEQAGKAERVERVADADATGDDLPAAVKALVEQLKDADGPVREAAALGLAKLGAKARGAAPALARRVADDVFAEHFSEGVYDKNAALAALKALAPKDVEAALLAAMKSKTPRVKTWAAQALTALEDK